MWIMYRKKQLIGLALATTLIIIALQAPVHQLFDRQALVIYFNSLGAWQILVFLLAHVVATVLAIPGTILVVVGGTLFGLVWGTVWSVIGATLGAIAAFWVARYLLHDWFSRLFYNHKAMRQLNRNMRQRALSYVLAVRFAPISPFNIVNFLFGLTSVPLKPYALGTFIGITPGTLAYTWLGISGKDALNGKSPLPLLLAFSLLVGLSLIPIVIRRQRNKIASP